MATAEFQELRLSVVLVDDASRGLAALRTEMRQFEYDGIRFIRNARESAEATRRVAGGVSESVKSLRNLGTTLSRAVNVGTVVIGAYVAATVWLAKLALEIEQLSNTAQLLGISYADLRNISEQMARKGLSQQTGIRIIGAVNALGLQLQSIKGLIEFQHKMQREGKIRFDPVELEAYTQALVNARGWHERIRIIQNAANELERKGLEAGRTKDQVAADKREFYIKQGLPAELALTGDITETTKEQIEKWGTQEQRAKRWNEITHKLLTNVKTIQEILMADSMDPDGPFYWMLKTAVSISGYIDRNLASWITSMTDAAAWLASVFGGSAEKGGPQTPSTMEGIPGLEPMGFEEDDDTPLKLEKLILEFRRFNENLRAGVPGGPEVVPAAYQQYASMATPGLQLPPAAAAGDIYTDKYGIWPGGGAKPTGSDVGPGYGAGAMGVAGPVGAGPLPAEQPINPNRYPWGPEGRFRSAPRGRWTRGGIPLFDINRVRGAAEGEDDAGPREIPGDFRMPGGGDIRDPNRSVKAMVAQPDYLAGTEPSTNIQDVRFGSWGGPGGASGTSQPPFLMQPWKREPEKSIFVPGLDVKAPDFPATQLGMNEIIRERFEYEPPRQKFELGSMRDLVQRRPWLYRGGTRRIEESIRRETETLNLPQIPFPELSGPRTGPGDLMPLPPPTAPALDRGVLDGSMGNEMRGGIEGGAGLTVNYNGPRGTEVKAEASGNIFNGNTEINRGPPPMEE